MSERLKIVRDWFLGLGVFVAAIAFMPILHETWCVGFSIVVVVFLSLFDLDITSAAPGFDCGTVDGYPFR